MNDQLKDELASIISLLKEQLENGMTFVGEQLPDIVNQLLLWYTVKSLIFFSIGLLVLVVSCGFFLKAYKEYRNRLYDDSVCRAAVGCFFLFFAGLIMCSNLGWLQIELAPKLYLLEYLKRCV